MWSGAEPRLLRFALRLLLVVGFVVSSPFFALALLFLLLGKPVLWWAVPAAAGGLLLAGALVAFLVVRWKAKEVGERIRQAEAAERWLRGQP